MQTTVQEKKYYRGSATLMFAPELADGSISEAMWALGNVTGFEHTITDTKETIRDLTQKAQPISTEILQERVEEWAFKGKELKLEHLRIRTMGEDGTAVTQAAAEDQTKTLEDIELDRYYALGKMNVSGLAGVKGVTPLVEHTDYELVDAVRGIVKLLSTATVIAAGDDVTFTFDCAAVASPGLPVIEGGTVQAVRGRLFMFGDPSHGDTWDLTVWRCEATPDGATGWVGSQSGEFGIKFKAVEDADHPDSSNRLTRIAAA